MTLNVKKIKYEGGNSKFPKQPTLDEGAYPARLVQIISLGLQPQQAWKGEEKPPVQELYTTYELQDEFVVDEEGNEVEDKPRWISETFPMHSLESDLAKSTKRYYALDPEEEHEGDWAELAGVACMVNIVKNPSKKDKEVVYNNISGVSGMRTKDAAKAVGLVNDPKVFDIDEPDMGVFTSLPKWLQDKMKSNLNYGGSALEEAVNNLGEEKPKEKQKPKKDKAPKKEEEGDDGVDW